MTFAAEESFDPHKKKAEVRRTVEMRRT